MKNLYLYSLLSTLFCLHVMGQNLQNSNWMLGANGQRNLIKFNPNANLVYSINPAAGYNAPTEGVASVSDSDGNLLLFTEGQLIQQQFNINEETFVINQDVIRGDLSSAQNVIIVPRPGFLRRYYIFTIVGATSPAANRGVYYTEVDLTNQGTPGTVVPGTLNIPLRDNNGLVLNETRNNQSEGITSARHSNCTDFWVVAHVTNPNNPNQGNFFSYLVTQDGVGVLGSGIPAGSPSSTHSFNNSVSGSNGKVFGIKVSPNSSRIAAAISNSGLFVGGFNNTTGAVTMPTTPTVPNDVGAYSVEFSQNSNMVYFSFSGSGDGSSVKQYNIINQATNTVGTLGQFDTAFGLQLGPDNRLYASTMAPGQFKLSVINNTNIVNSTFNSSISLGMYSSFGLPQLVMNHDDCCFPTLTTSNVISTMIHQERSSWIKTTDLIFFEDGIPGNGVVYHAGDFVELNPGFEAEVGSQFSAYIQGCTGNYVYKNENDNLGENQDVKNDLIKNKVNIYPNPTSGLLNISFTDNKIKKILLTSIEGKVFVFEQFDNSENVVLDLSNYASGIYLMNIETGQGEIINSKIIKN